MNKLPVVDPDVIKSLLNALECQSKIEAQKVFDECLSKGLLVTIATSNAEAKYYSLVGSGRMILETKIQEINCIYLLLFIYQASEVNDVNIEISKKLKKIIDIFSVTYENDINTVDPFKQALKAIQARTLVFKRINNLSSKPTLLDRTSLLVCHCNRVFDSSVHYLTCANCQKLYHGDCVQIDKKEAFEIENYICANCSTSRVETTYLPSSKKRKNFLPINLLSSLDNGMANNLKRKRLSVESEGVKDEKKLIRDSENNNIEELVKEVCKVCSFTACKDTICCEGCFSWCHSACVASYFTFKPVQPPSLDVPSFFCLECKEKDACKEKEYKTVCVS